MKNRECIKCKSKEILDIIYGYPSEELLNEAMEGKVKLGGCCIEEDQPEYYCRACGYAWNKEEILSCNYEDIECIEVSIGGFFQGYYDVNINFIRNKVIYKKHGDGPIRKPIEKRLEKVDIEEFINKLEEVKLLDWKAKYAEEVVCDGTQWSIKINTSKGFIKKYGDNKFPRKWNAFCKAIENLIKEKLK